jgi:hypothetical protein
MTSQNDLKTLPTNVPVLCIPRVRQNINESSIRKIFDELNMGTLERIDIVGKKNDIINNKRIDNMNKKNDKDTNFNRVFIHFRQWNDSENAQTARELLLAGKEIKIIYDDPWFWKISAYREYSYKEGERKFSKTSGHLVEDKKYEPVINLNFI